MGKGLMGTHTALEAGFGVEVDAHGSLVAVTAKTPFGSKALHFTPVQARMLADALGFAANDADDAAAGRKLGALGPT